MTNHQVPSDELAERLLGALSDPQSITDDELFRWTADEEARQTLHAAAQMRRAALEQHHADSSGEAFQQFRQAHGRPRATIVSMAWKSALLAAAACLAAWWLMPTPTTAPVRYGSASIIYHASPAASPVVTIANANEPTMAVSQLPKATAATTRSVVLQGDTIVCPPMNLADYQISRQTITVPNGHIAKLILPDGTRVWLNNQSSLIYPNSFSTGKPRQVRLQGEAYFEVARNEQQPFIVECDRLQTLVLGTSFNIRSYEGTAPCVTLVSGSVSVQAGNRSVVLKPSQSATLHEGKRLQVVESDTEQATCWREGLFYFDDRSMHDVLIEMGRWYNMDVLILSDARLSDHIHFRGERDWTPTEMAAHLSMLSHRQISIEDGAIIVR